MKLFLYLLICTAFPTAAQHPDADTLNLGECWNIDYHYDSDLDQKKYRLEIQYINEDEFLIKYSCLVADSFSIFNHARFLGRRDNPNDTTLLASELAFLETNKLHFDVLQPFNAELLKKIDAQPNILYFLHYSTSSVSEVTFPRERYDELLICLLYTSPSPRDDR